MEPIVTLGLDDNRHVMGPPTVLERDGRGRFYTAFAVTPGGLSVFDSTGAFLMTIGRQGSGPGEYRYIPAVVPAHGDTLHVFDPVLRRETVLSPQYDVVSSRPIETPATPHGAIVLANNRVIMHSIMMTRSTIGLPLHLLRADGTIERSYGALNPVIDIGTATARTMRWIASAENGGVWTVPGIDYHLELWDTTGTRLMELTRDVDWFRVHEDSPRSDRDDVGSLPPPPQMGPIWYDPRGLLWVVIRLPDDDWETVVPRAGPDGPQYGPDTYNDRYDSQIEIIDVRRSRLVTRERVDAMILAVTHDGYFYSYGETHDARPFIEIWRGILDTQPQQVRR